MITTTSNADWIRQRILVAKAFTSRPDDPGYLKVLAAIDKAHFEGVTDEEILRSKAQVEAFLAAHKRQ